MKKSLVALAVGAAFAAPAAYADVTISGAINMGVEFLSVSDGDDATCGTGPDCDGLSNFGVASNYSNVTISSIDDLGGGLKLDFAYQITAPTSSVGDVSNRNSHIGLVSDSWGGIWYGSNENIYERYYYSVDPLDGAAGLGGNLAIMGTPGGAVFGTYGASADNPAGGYTWYRRDEQVIWYDSPNFGGFTFGVVWQTNFNKSNDAFGTGTGIETNPSMWQIGAKYVGTSMPLQAWAAYGDRSDQFGLIGAAANRGVAISASGSSDTAIQLGAGWTLGDIFIFANYEMLEYELSDVAGGLGPQSINQWERDAFSVGMKWNLASGYLGAQYIQALEASCDLAGGGDCSFADDTGASQISVGYYHNLSKQTQAYIVGAWLSNDDNANYGTAGIGNDALFNPGTTAYGIGVGLKHSF
jgi:predicted porin